MRNEEQRSPTYRDGQYVVVTELTDEMVEQEADTDGQLGKVDMQRSDGQYLVLFPGARGWFIPEGNLRAATDDEISEWRRPW